MPFIWKRKKFKFLVELSLHDLVCVPFVNSVLFVELRLLHGGHFSVTSTKKDVCNNRVEWSTSYQFSCTISADSSTLILDPCILRAFLRREINGGKSFQKLGFCDFNLSEFAGLGAVTKSCIFDCCEERHRPDNAMLRLTFRMNMVSSDIVFRIPQSSFNPSGQPNCEKFSATLIGHLNYDNDLTISDAPFSKSKTNSLDYSSYSPPKCCKRKLPSDKHRKAKSLGSSWKFFSFDRSAFKSRNSNFVVGYSSHRRYLENTRVNADDLINDLLSSNLQDVSGNEDVEIGNLEMILDEDGSISFRPKISSHSFHG